MHDMFIRFVVNELDRSSGKRRGIFQAAHCLRNTGALPDYDDTRLADALRWFDAHLPKPARLGRAGRPHWRATAICWFKRDATAHLERIREVQHLLDAYGVAVEMITSRRPGYIVYEDESQVAACPFDETPA